MIINERLLKSSIGIGEFLEVMRKTHMKTSELISKQISFRDYFQPSVLHKTEYP